MKDYAKEEIVGKHFRNLSGGKRHTAAGRNASWRWRTKKGVLPMKAGG
jgi:hypothetical protein